MKILHPTDFSQASQKALKLAQLLRDLTGGSLTILHAAEPRYASAAHFFDTQTEKIFDEAEQAWSVLMARQLEGLDARAQTVLEPRKPIPVILRHAAEHDLVVMGTHGEDSLADRLLGTTTERVIAQSSRPVAAVPQEANAQGLAHLLVGFGPTPGAERVLRLAHHIAEASGGKITVLHVGDADELERINQAIGTLPLALEGRLEAKVLSTAQPPAAALLGFAYEQQADALFVGRSRAGGFFGSVTRWILNHAQVPVFVQP
ncbi:universal stress protein [Meiothermus hypogaeus]|uniref:Universal stress protein n=2 Tax=Meiothermus hypogaeus TaxID=884155 RepID=A0A511R134_9DEIN|nr:universal stress protein [Meiothermus hypogaeus]RIH80598.1 Universal stress protein family protein [Meiothermus hypogaeus]GEM83323.1 universal stress protein [Meiothermus hypogaeus NBRC 106114]GIW36306.1 MAG: universal stress protein [Meiothermus sp.]